MMQATADVYRGSTPLVSVAITAYNSELFLGRALDTVLAQQVDFPFEIVIADDCSKDGTVAIANSYAERYPGVVRVLAHPANIGIQRNYYSVFEACRGKYTAWLDADDYWTDPEKLAIQVKLLEADPTVAICGHVVRFVTPERELVKERHPSTAPGRYGLEAILRSCFLPTLSVVFRTGAHRKLPEWYFDVAPTTDWPLWLVAAQEGDIVLLDRNMGDYTLTPGSAFMGQGALFGNQKDIRFYEHAQSILTGRFRRIARAAMGKRYETVAYLLRKKGDFKGSRKAAVKAFCIPGLLDNAASKSKALVAAVVRELQSRVASPARH